MHDKAITFVCFCDRYEMLRARSSILRMCQTCVLVEIHLLAFGSISRCDIYSSCAHKHAFRTLSDFFALGAIRKPYTGQSAKTPQHSESPGTQTSVPSGSVISLCFLKRASIALMTASRHCLSSSPAAFQSPSLNPATCNKQVRIRPGDELAQFGNVQHGYVKMG